ncbi:hypothetical protein KOR42_33080 [Thalassoglobus neptunius]|uniref:Uncharacterized protein n=1 Tax=Thalassoglobus neptunius TaxID=1938619 RepID=A0A5C5WNP4_9PLAN|nr:hypothetical protein [Thalassoglobus neptunius]TWT51835.1 hypothetical protein KOR42_33080 [Thalassoglobus neptunius]
MANVYMTLADIAKINDKNLADIEVTDLLDDAPVLKVLGADESSNGESHKYTKETGAPVVGFRAANDGRENKASADTLVTIALKILDASFTVDKAVADIHNKGPEYILAREGRRHLKAAMAGAEAQFFYGVGADSAGFAALADNAGLNGLSDAMVVNATGTTADTGSSVWAIRTNDSGSDLMAIGGGRGNSGFNIEWGETEVIRAAGSTGFYPAYFTPISAWMGLQIGSAYSVGRIANLTADAGKGLTDDLIAELLSKFPATRKPNLLAMSRRSLLQLQQSRTATNATGAPAPFPTESHNVPIVVTDSIGNTEALLT